MSLRAWLRSLGGIDDRVGAHGEPAGQGAHMVARGVPVRWRARAGAGGWHWPMVDRPGELAAILHDMA
ncbi:hypothetical protein [Streptomyces sp. NEAU-174]|uniref:hypothetical protein n=1 Tax=Streptomyces sp. NEAU-174 TaxID=3458254 RepID=UPI0040440E5B